jgi:REP element-mobilizing transposase RayT
MRLNHAGKLIESIWQETVSRYKSVQSDIYIVMPNHFHCIVSIANRRIGADMESAPTIPSRSMAANPLSTHFVGADSISAPTVGEVIQSFKRNSTVKYIDGVNAGIYPPFNKRIWQRNYYEHIIWNETDYETKWKYIEENPARWTEDEYYDLPLVPAGPGVFQSN